MTDDLVKRLWESDEASALTNQAARRIEKLKAKLDLSEGALDVASRSWGECQRMLEQTEAKLEELLVVSKRAVRLSLDHADFKLYAMEPMHQAIAAAELKGRIGDE